MVPNQNGSVSANEYARHRGVSGEAVRKAIREGRIPTRPDGSIDPHTADRAWRDNTSHVGGKRGEKTPPIVEGVSTPVVSETGAVSYSEAERRRMVALAEEAELRVHVKRGTLIDREVAERKVYELAAATRDSWMTWPLDDAERIATDLGVPDVARVRRVLEQHVRARLARLPEIVTPRVCREAGRGALRGG